MAEHDIVVVGASAGGVEALQQLVSGLPADYQGSLFVVLHIPPRVRSMLPQLLARVCALPVVHPADGEVIRPGHIYVAPPDHHLVVEQGHMHLSIGPKEQHHRPCINVLFRSAASAYSERVVGVVLTGELDDGTAGLWEISRRGGIKVVQHPESAAFPSMPLSALREVEADYVLPLGEIAGLLVRLQQGSAGAHRKAQEGVVTTTITDLTCPDCCGTIWQVALDKGLEYRCRVGHTFSPP